jgi:acyl dehydratase
MAEKELHFEDVELGDDIGPVERTITDEQVQAFVQIWGAESGPSRFTSEEVAKGEGLPGMIVPGAMNVGVISQLLTGWSSSVVLKTLDLMFRQMVRHDVPILLKGIVTDKNVVDGEPQVECDIWMEGPDGTRLVIGKAIVVLPTRE